MFRAGPRVGAVVVAILLLAGCAQARSLVERPPATIPASVATPRQAVPTASPAPPASAAGSVAPTATGGLPTPLASPTAMLPSPVARPATVTVSPLADQNALAQRIALTPPVPRPVDAAGHTGLGPFPLPVRVRIPRIGVNAEIESVGVDANGAMERPSAADVVAWYGYGVAPGMAGASVLAGHVDSVKGPAIFWSLKDLQPGDTIDVQLLGNVTRHFVVEQAVWYATNSAPLNTIFAEGGPARLNLITCGGTFDHASHLYDKRLVVYTRLASDAGDGSVAPSGGIGG